MPRELRKEIPLPNYYIRLKDIRLSLGLEIQEMGKLVGLPQVTYLYYERQQTLEIAPEAFVNFSLCLGLSVDYLLGLTDIPMSYSIGPVTAFVETPDTTRIREIRLERCITGKAMAENLDISPGAYSTKELHPELLSFTIVDLIRIAQLFQLPVDYLLKVTNATVPNPPGTHGYKPLKMVELRQVKNKLGLNQCQIKTSDAVQNFCNEHYRVRCMRLERNLRQADVAVAIGVKILTYSVWERNLSRIPAYFLIKLANFYGVTVDYLVGNSDSY